MRVRSCGLELGTALGEQGLDFRGGKRAEAMDDGAGADGGQQLPRIFGEQDDSDVCSGGSSRTLRRQLAASFMKAELVKMVKARRASTGGR